MAIAVAEVVDMLRAEKEVEDRDRASIQRSIFYSWLKALSQQHKIASIFLGKDTIYTKPEKIMVVGIFLLWTMAVNCFLFLFAGNANEGTPNEIVVQQIQYGIMTTVRIAIFNHSFSHSYTALASRKLSHF